MRISHFFIDRPIFASRRLDRVRDSGRGRVLRACRSRNIPRSRRRSSTSSGQYPGANAEVVASTVVAPIEEQINGVENMLYMSSNSNGDGRFSIARHVRYRHQPRHRAGAGAEPRRDRAAAPAGRRAQHRRHGRQGLARPDDGRAPAIRPTSRATRCSSPTTPMLEIKDALTRVDGVGSITVFGSRDYAMRDLARSGAPAIART